MTATNTLVDSFTIYCLATGKPIASVSDDECGFILDSLEAQGILESNRALHLERLTLSSMRNSLPWMNVTPRFIEHLRASNPKELLAYLMNRLYASVDIDKRTGQPLNHESFLNARRMRIHMWQSIDSCELSTYQINSILYVLLRIDSQYSLAKIAAPTNIISLWDSWASDLPGFVQALWDWDKALAVAELDRLRRAKWQAEFWSEGNRMTRMALGNQFGAVTPPYKLTAETLRGKRIRKETKVAKAAELKDSLDWLDQLEASYVANPAKSDETLPSQPKVVNPSKPAPTGLRFTRFGKKG